MSSYTKNTWTPGDVITAERMNNIEEGIDNVVQEINGNGGQGTLWNKIDDMILISPTQPTSPNNEIWVNSDSATNVQVPTYAEFENLESGIAELQNTITTLTTRINELEYQLATYNTKKFCDNITPHDGSVNGVGFYWTGNYRCSINGTAQSNAESDYFVYSDNLAADGLEPGKFYFLRFSRIGSGTRVRLHITYWTQGDGDTLIPHSEDYTQEANYFLPRNAVAFGLSLIVYASASYVSENVFVGLYSAAPSNKDLYTMITNLQNSSNNSGGTTPIIVG